MFLMLSIPAFSHSCEAKNPVSRKTSIFSLISICYCCLPFFFKKNYIFLACAYARQTQHLKLINWSHLWVFKYFMNSKVQRNFTGSRYLYTLVFVKNNSHTHKSTAEMKTRAKKAVKSQMNRMQIQNGFHFMIKD